MTTPLRDYTELKKRLVERHNRMSTRLEGALINMDGPEALKAIEELEKRVRVLSEALKPFAENCIKRYCLEGTWTDSEDLSEAVNGDGNVGLTVGDLRKAALALKSKTPA